VQAIPRRAPYIHAKWMAELMAGAPCQWRYWFLVHNQLQERATEFDDPAWHMKHSRLLTELEQELRAKGLEPEIESEFTMPLNKFGAALAGRMDCLVVDPAAQVATVRDCKTGSPKAADKLQVLVYMHTLTKRLRFRDLGLRGEVVYPDHREEIARFPVGFAEDFDFWIHLLLAEKPPRKVPGQECRFCPISSNDCPDRVEWNEENGPIGDWLID
jgi:hypothetical protein